MADIPEDIRAMLLGWAAEVESILPRTLEEHFVEVEERGIVLTAATDKLLKYAISLRAPHE